jgi:hypothetical protein
MLTCSFGTAPDKVSGYTPLNMTKEPSGYDRPATPPAIEEQTTAYNGKQYALYVLGLYRPNKPKCPRHGKNLTPHSDTHKDTINFAGRVFELDDTQAWAYWCRECQEEILEMTAGTRREAAEALMRGRKEIHTADQIIHMAKFETYAPAVMGDEPYSEIISNRGGVADGE